MTSRYQIIHSDNYFSFNEYGGSCLLINLHAGSAKLEIGRGGSSTSSWVWMTDSLSPYPPSPYHCFSYSGFTTTTSLDLLFPFMEQPLSIIHISIRHITVSLRSFQVFYHHFTSLGIQNSNSLSISPLFKLLLLLLFRFSTNTLFYFTLLLSLAILGIVFSPFTILGMYIVKKNTNNAGFEILVWG